MQVRTPLRLIHPGFCSNAELASKDSAVFVLLRS